MHSHPWNTISVVSNRQSNIFGIIHRVSSWHYVNGAKHLTVLLLATWRGQNLTLTFLAFLACRIILSRLLSRCDSSTFFLSIFLSRFLLSWFKHSLLLSSVQSRAWNCCPCAMPYKHFNSKRQTWPQASPGIYVCLSVLFSLSLSCCEDFGGI